jgi:hypothetical protein
MYADWTAIGWSMILGKPPTGKGLEPTGNGAHDAAEPKRAAPVAGAEPAKKARARPAARKSMAKKSAAKRTTGRSLRAAPAKRRSARSKRR